MTQHLHVQGECPDFFVSCYQRIRSIVHEQCRCRHCGDYSSFTANVCETCGTQDPVRIPIFWGIALLGIGAMLFATGAWIMM